MNFSKIVCSVLVASIIFGVSRDAFAAGNDALAKAKQQADSKGYVFYSTHDEIVAKAKERGGELRVLAEMEPGHIKDAMASFKKKYPFLDIYIEEITGTDQARRNIL